MRAFFITFYGVPQQKVPHGLTLVQRCEVEQNMGGLWYANRSNDNLSLQRGVRGVLVVIVFD